MNSSGKLLDDALHRVVVGSCTLFRIEDAGAAAEVAKSIVGAAQGQGESDS